jgi:hypothetical protein
MHACSQYQTLWANDGTHPEEIGSCLRPFHYDEKREDFVPTHSSTLRLSYNEGRTVVDMDNRSTVQWHRCMTSSRAHAVLAKVSDKWRTSAKVGIVASTGQHRQEHFELMSMKLYTGAQEAQNTGEPDDGPNSDTAVRIAHHLEHGLFEVHDDIEHMVHRLEAKAHRDAQRIADLEAKLSAGAFNVMERRLMDLEARLSRVSVPMLEDGVRRVEQNAARKLEKLQSSTSYEAHGWKRPFVIAAVMLGVFCFYVWRENQAIGKFNKTFM